MKKIRERSYIRTHWGEEPLEDFSGRQAGNNMHYYGFDNPWFPLGGSWTKNYAYTKIDPKTTTIIIPSEFT